MLVFKKVADLQRHLKHLTNSGKTIAFAPTMGALHDGHLQLIKMANDLADVSVASIFVNPTQFNDPKDLEKYPRTMQADMAALHSAGCSILFAPSAEEVYPPDLDVSLSLDFGKLATVMEGKFRPGHFDGMATVVHRLLDIVRPHKLIMGQKDFQQLTIVREMLRQTQSSVELIMCPTKREEDGLAMSSRNTRLTKEMRQIAPRIYETLQKAKQLFIVQSAQEVEDYAMQTLEKAGFKPEYFTFFDGITLQPVQNYHDSELIVAALAAWAGDIRLIDNMVMKGDV